MTELHPSFKSNQNVSLHSKNHQLSSQPLLFSARPKVQELPFLNNLKLARNLLVTIKNQKLRKSLYVVNQDPHKALKEENELKGHQKAKLSVMDLISEEAKFEELSNTIQSNLNKNSQSISPIMMNKKSSLKQDLHEFNIMSGICQPLKGKQKDGNKDEQVKRVQQRPTVLSRKNELASELNKLGHELQETYLQVDELEKIFTCLCNFYGEKRNLVEKNLKLKEEKDILKEQLQEYESKIRKNEEIGIGLRDKKDDFLDLCKQKAKEYIKEVIEYNNEINSINQKMYQDSSTTLSQTLKQPYNPSIHSQQNSNNEEKHFKLNLKFKQLKSQLQKVKQDKKNMAQTKNNQKKNKNQNTQNNTFSKLYVSQIYSL